MAPPNPAQEGNDQTPSGEDTARRARAAPDAALGSEDAVLERIGKLIEARLGPPPPGEIWMGDDAAVVSTPRRAQVGTGVERGSDQGKTLLLSTDAVVEGVHFDLSLVSLEDVGWKALTAAVSDICAMGGRPLHALASASLPDGTDVDGLMAGLISASLEWGCPLVGGDLTSATQIVIGVSVTGGIDEIDETGEGDGRRPQGAHAPVTRSGARPGDQLFLTGPVGGSAAGLRLLRSGIKDSQAVETHRRPMARVAEGVTARLAGATAMMDVSDGLSLDLHRLATASGVGLSLFEVPLADEATIEEGLGGGEDYELVIATNKPTDLRAAFAAFELRPPLHIGECTSDPRDRLLGTERMPVIGWQHQVGG